MLGFGLILALVASVILPAAVVAADDEESFTCSLVLVPNIFELDPGGVDTVTSFGSFSRVDNESANTVSLSFVCDTDLLDGATFSTEHGSTVWYRGLPSFVDKEFFAGRLNGAATANTSVGMLEGTINAVVWGSGTLLPANILEEPFNDVLLVADQETIAGRIELQGDEVEVSARFFVELTPLGSFNGVLSGVIEED